MIDSKNRYEQITALKLNGAMDQKSLTYFVCFFFLGDWTIFPLNAANNSSIIFGGICRDITLPPIFPISFFEIPAETVALINTTSGK